MLCKRKYFSVNWIKKKKKTSINMVLNDVFLCFFFFFLHSAKRLSHRKGKRSYGFYFLSGIKYSFLKCPFKFLKYRILIKTCQILISHEKKNIYTYIWLIGLVQFFFFSTYQVLSIYQTHFGKFSFHLGKHN